MKNKIIIYVFCVLYAITASCTDPFAKEQFVPYEEKPIGLYIESIPKYSQWVKLLKKADLFNAVNLYATYTLFVADNDAVNRYLSLKGWKSIDNLTEEEASSLVKYHIIAEGAYAYSSLGTGKISDQTSSGDYLTITTNANASIKYINGVEIMKDAVTEGGDTKFTNGYIHEIKDVMDPIIYTVMELLEKDSKYKIFTEALKECGLDKYLGRRDIFLNKKKIRDYKTVMAITDSVFQAKGINSLVDLKAKFKGEPTDKRSDFYKYVGYHIFGKSYDFAELTGFQLGKKGLNMETFVPREFISVSQKGEEIFINATGNEVVQFINGKYDIPANNGYIHQISGLMEISDPIRFPFSWEPTEWDEFRTIEFYRKPRVKNDGPEMVVWLKEKEAPHFRWRTIPYREEVLAYVSSDIDWDRFSNDDFLSVSLGEVGWVEFDTPTLMRGKYKIELIKWSWWTNKGKFQMYIDDIKFGPEINTTGGTGGSINLGVFRFEDSGAHVFRFNVVGSGDNVLRIDRFIFTPVD